MKSVFIPPKVKEVEALAKKAFGGMDLVFDTSFVGTIEHGFGKIEIDAAAITVQDKSALRDMVDRCGNYDIYPKIDGRVHIGIMVYKY